jgi:hypothetical protein
MIKFNFALLSLLLLLACSKEQNGIKYYSQIRNSYTLIAKDTLSLPLNYVSSHEIHHPMYFMDSEGNEFIITFNMPMNRITLFDIKQKRIHKILNIPTKGPKSIGNISGYYYLNHDTIFLERNMASKIYLVDSSIQTKRIYSTKMKNDDQGSFATKRQPIQYSNGKLILRKNKFEDGNTPSYYQKSGLTLLLDINSGELTPHPVGYPDMYRKGEYFGVSLSEGNLSYGKNGISFSAFNTDDHIYAYNEKSLIKSSYLPSQLTKIKPTSIAPRDDENFDKYTKILAKSASYHILRHDPYHNLLYRWVVYPSDEYKDPITGEINFGRNKPFSIQIIDEELNQVGEVEFPRYTYDFLFGMVPTPHGLLFNMYHPLNEEVEEDVLKFVIFEVKKKEQ